MSFLQGLFSSNSSAPAAAPAPAATNPGGPTPAEGQQAAQQGVTPTGQPTPGNPTSQPTAEGQGGEFNPLDALSVLRQNSGTPSTTAPSLSFTPEQLSEASSKLDFAKLIPQDSLAKLQEGFANGDLSALPEVLAGLAKNSWQLGLQHNTALVDTYVNNRLSFEQDNQARTVREGVLTSQLQSIQSLHPEAKQFFVSTAKQLSNKYPEATPKQIEDEVWTIMRSFSKELDVDGKNQQIQAKAAEMDWDKYLDS